MANIKVPKGKKLAWLCSYGNPDVKQLVLVTDDFQNGDDVYADNIDICVGSNQTIREVEPDDDISYRLYEIVEISTNKTSESL